MSRQLIFYIEKEVADHPRVAEVLQRFPESRQISIEKYSEVFNRKNQDFRVQKSGMQTFILAKKRKQFALPVPFEYSQQTLHNFYFSHLYNCPYDCEYCYLQGMYRSAFFLWFVNYEDFFAAITRKIAQFPHERHTFFSGYDCDSLALESITHFAQEAIPFFETLPNAEMELRTKSVNIHSLLMQSAPKNTFVTWTLSPEFVVKNWEHKTPSLQARVAALVKLQNAGWRIQIRIEPVMAFPQWEKHYADFFQYLSEYIDFAAIENMGFGTFRLPKHMFKKMQKLLPESTLLHQYYELRATGEMSYPPALEKEMLSFFHNECQKLISAEKILYYDAALTAKK